MLITHKIIFNGLLCSLNWLVLVFMVASKIAKILRTDLAPT